MASFKYFTTCQGQPVELTGINHNGGLSIAPASFSGSCPSCGQRHQADRKIEFKASPSLHKCDDRCLHATGRVMKCECSCGGKNHGRGSVSEAA